MANEVLGECICPVCKSEYQQEIRKAKTGKPYLNCDECGVQIFARQPASVKILRSMATLGQKPDSLSVPVKQPEVAPVAVVTPEKKEEGDETPLLDFLLGSKKKAVPVAERGGVV